MTRNYINIKYDEMKEYLELKGFKETKRKNTLEKCFINEYKTNKNPLSILIYTGIYKNNSRDKGKDAIRTLIIDSKDNIVHQTIITHRIEKWEINLLSKISECDNIITGFYDMRDIAQQKINFCKLRDIDKPYVNYDFSKLSHIGVKNDNIML